MAFEKGNNLGGRPKGSKNKFNPAKDAAKAWFAADLTYKYRPVQKQINDQFITAKQISRKFILNCSRRLGKSTWKFIKCVEACLAEPGVNAAFIAPVNKNLDQYIRDISKMVFNDVPEELRPAYSANKTVYEFPNGSRLMCAGANRDSYNQLRGYKLKRAAIDEAAQIDELKGLIKDVLLPALFDSEGDLLVGSTPPVSPDHYFKELCEEAELGCYYAKYTIHDAGYPEARIREWYNETVKKPSDVTTWQREYLAMFVVDSERALCPEWKDTYECEWKRDDVLFPFYVKWFGMDSGARDKTVGLHGYYDFKNAKLIIEDEFSLQGSEVRTDVIAGQIRLTEEKLGYTDVTRYADNDNLILIQDLTSFHDLPIMSVTKDSLDAMVNQVRLMVNEGRIIVNPRCKLLIATLKGGIWNLHRTEFQRSETLGHCDAFAALMYIVRTINMVMNPIPNHLGINGYTHHLEDLDPNSSAKEAWKKMLGLNQKDEFEEF